MKELEQAKKDYDSISIPEELSSQTKNTLSKKSTSAPHKRYLWKYALSTAAAFMLCFITLLNSSESFAKGAVNIPLIGSLAEVLTIRSYTKEDGNKIVSVKVPEVKITDNNNESTESQETIKNTVIDVNAQIEKLVDDYVADANTRMDEYQEAFLATGGTKEEWDEKGIAIDVDYKVLCQNDRYLSIMIIANENWVSSYGINYYYNIDMHTGKELTLGDFLGNDYIAAANASICSQISENQKNDPDNYPYFSEEEGGFTSINSDTKFYINQENYPVIVFDKYEIAPGSMGIQEFVIS